MVFRKVHFHFYLIFLIEVVELLFSVAVVFAAFKIKTLYSNVFCFNVKSKFAILSVMTSEIKVL